MFTYQQIQAMRGHRFGSETRDERLKRSRKRGTSSLHELLVALGDGLARIGTRDGGGKIRPASPAY